MPTKKKNTNVSKKQADLEINREDSADQFLTTNQGVRVNDNQNSLKVGDRGPSLLEDFIMREKITHFDHERIPERIVHARGSGLTAWTRSGNFIASWIKNTGMLLPTRSNTPSSV